MEAKPRILVGSTGQRRSTPIVELPFLQSDLPEDALKESRLSAWKEYIAQPFPSTKEEAWRRTDLKSMPVGSFTLPSTAELSSDGMRPPEVLTRVLHTEEASGKVIQAAGNDRTSFLDPKYTQKGVIFSDLRSAIAEHTELVRQIRSTIVKPSEGKFASLATAFAQDGVLLYVPKGVVIEQPLLSLLWKAHGGVANFSHVLVWLEDGAQATLMHEAASADGVPASLHAGIVELNIGTGASLRFVELQSWGREMWNISHARARVGRDANLDWIFGSIGSKLTKNFTRLELAGEGANGRISGFYFADGSQHLDHDTRQDHLAPHTTSDLLFKGALKGKSRSVWQGMIYVAPDAQKTDGYQANRNLVLSADARADSIPGLEILADDVRCTHGATVGKLDPEPLFYLKTRGIPDDEAEHLLVAGFFDPIMQRIPFDGVKERFQQAILKKMQVEQPK